MRVDRNVELKWENMYRGIHAQIAWLSQAPEELLTRARQMLTEVPPRIYLVGCGDSHYVGLATRLAFERWSGIPTEALESLEFSRYVVDYAPSGSWVVCVSNSGRVARTRECALFAKQHGLFPVAVTFDPESPLAQLCEATLAYRYTDVGFGPGTLSYLASLVSLYAIALRAGELSGKLDQTASQHWLATIQQQSAIVEATIAACETPTAALGKQCEMQTPIQIIGAGPNYGTALFGMAKFIEAARISAVGQELEEWAHEQYFCTGPGTVTIVLAPRGASSNRAREQLQAVRDMRGLAVTICSPDDIETTTLADIVFPVPGSIDEVLTPIAYCVPLELFAYHFASSKELTMLGFDDSSRMEVNFRQIFSSQIGTTDGAST
jgi:glucosamine--fructose-6-phosphate aminotransferase (isomerizing)